MADQYKYFAFISYSSQDTAWGKRLQKKLEGYRMPSIMCSEHGWKRKPIRPVFFAPTDIQPGDLSNELKERLKASHNLIVICSPGSAKSDWVAKEIDFFHALGRVDNIYFFIVRGIPHSGNPDTECFSPIVKRLGIPEKLGANIHEKVFRSPWLNRERAYIQLITKLLDVEFDSIWQRHRRMLRQKIVAWCVGILAVIATLVGVLVANQPVDVRLGFQETTVHNDNLPPLKDAIVALELDNETKTDTVHSLDDKALFVNVPLNDMGKTVRIRLTCVGWMPVDTEITLSKNPSVRIARNPETYGKVCFRLWSLKYDKGVANTKITIAGHSAVTDAQGRVSLTIPLRDQCEKYRVECALPLENDTLSMPTTPSTALIVKEQ